MLPLTKKLFSTFSIARPVTAMAVSVLFTLPVMSHAEVVELTPNELNSAYIKDSTIYIPKATQERIQKKVVNVKVLPGEPNPDQIDRDEELREGAKRTVISGFTADGTWDATRRDNSLATATQPSVETSPLYTPPRVIPGAPDGFQVPEGAFSYTAQDLINMGFTHPTTGQPLSQISDGGIVYGNNYALGSPDGQNIDFRITLPADFQSRIPPQGINSEILTITPDLQNAINIRLQVPQQ